MVISHGVAGIYRDFLEYEEIHHFLMDGQTSLTLDEARPYLNQILELRSDAHVKHYALERGDGTTMWITDM